MNWITHHWALAAVVGTWIFNNIITVLVSNLPAPTKESTVKYVYWFKVSNSFIGNFRRAASTAIEQSPNWQAAVEAHVAKIASMNQVSPPPSSSPSAEPKEAPKP